jgi:hypothetical protein
MSTSRPAAAPSGGSAPPVPDPDEVAAAATACPSVVELSGGAFGEISTYLPGRRVSGVRVRDDSVAVHVVAHHGTPVAEIADQVRRAVEPLVGGRRVDVGVDDLELPVEESSPGSAPSPGAPAGAPAGAPRGTPRGPGVPTGGPLPPAAP